MPDKKLTDKEIVKALECCGNQLDCVGCECVENCPQDINELNGLAFDLINRQQAENEDIKFLYENLKEEHLEIIKAIKHTKAEAYKEFAKRLKSYLLLHHGEIYGVLFEGIDNLLKELVGDNNET